VSSPPENAIPIRSPPGRLVSTFDTRVNLSPGPL
jgi:hypothetical protein